MNSTHTADLDSPASALATAFRSAVLQVEDVVVMADHQGTITYANPAFEALTGYARTEIVGQKPHKILCVPEDPAILREALAAVQRGEIWRGQVQLATRKGRLLHADVHLQGITDDRDQLCLYVVTGRDLTAQEEERRDLQDAQRLDTLRTLVNGIAHRFNNILASLMGHAELLTLSPDTPPKILERAKKMLTAAEAGRQFVLEMKAYSGRTPPGKERVDIAPIAHRCADFIMTATQRGVQVTMSGPESGAFVEAVPGEIEQVLMNLLANAVQSLPEGREGKITVSLKEEKGAFPNEVDAWTIEVDDNGSGIDPKHQPRIFEPYFTTREQADHAGMGLPVAQNIAQRHGGLLTFTTEPNVGTRFVFALPQHTEEAAQVASPTTEASGSRKGHVMLVDDEELITAAGEELLRSMEYEVTGFTDPRAAQAAFQAEPEKFDFVLTDLTMPGLNGLQLAEFIKARRPELPILLCSGFNEKLDAPDARSKGIDVVLNKPCPAAEMDRALRRAATIAKNIKR